MAFRFSARRAFALALMAITFLPFLNTRVSAHDASDTSTENQVFLLYRGPDGDIACREASAAERSQLEVARPQGLRQINHIDEAKPSGPGAEALPAHLT